MVSEFLFMYNFPDFNDQKIKVILNRKKKFLQFFALFSKNFFFSLRLLYYIFKKKNFFFIFLGVKNTEVFEYGVRIFVYVQLSWFQWPYIL